MPVELNVRGGLVASLVDLGKTPAAYFGGHLDVPAALSSQGAVVAFLPADVASAASSRLDPTRVLIRALDNQPGADLKLPLVVLEVDEQGFAAPLPAALGMLAEGGMLALLGTPVDGDEPTLRPVGIYGFSPGTGLRPASTTELGPVLSLFQHAPDARPVSPEPPEPMTGPVRSPGDDLADGIVEHLQRVAERPSEFSERLEAVAAHLRESQMGIVWGLVRAALDLSDHADGLLTAFLFGEAHRHAPGASPDVAIRRQQAFTRVMAAWPTRARHVTAVVAQLADLTVSDPSLAALAAAVLDRLGMPGRALLRRCQQLRGRLLYEIPASPDLLEQLAAEDAALAALQTETAGRPSLLVVGKAERGAGEIHAALAAHLGGRLRYDVASDPEMAAVTVRFLPGPCPLLHWTDSGPARFQAALEDPDHRFLLIDGPDASAWRERAAERALVIEPGRVDAVARVCAFLGLDAPAPRGQAISSGSGPLQTL